MSQKAKRSSTALEDKDKSRSDTPVKDMKKKTAANMEKEKVAAEKSAAEQSKVAPEQSKTSVAQSKTVAEQIKAATEQNKTAAVQGKAAVEQSKATVGQGKAAVDQSKTMVVLVKAAVDQPKTTAMQSKTATEQSKTTVVQSKATVDQSKTPTAQSKSPAAPSKTPAMQGKPPTPATPQGQNKVNDIPLPTEKKDDAKIDKSEKPKAVAEPAEKPKQNGESERARGANNGDAAVAPDEPDDESFPELAYDDASDDGEAPGRSATRRDQVKPTRTPETPRPASHRIGNGDDKMTDETADSPKPDTKLLKLREEFSASPMRLRSSDRSTPDPGAAAPTADGQPTDGAVDENDELKAEDESVSKKDTNFSKSRIKISPYRRSSRLQDSMLANYTGNNTTMEMDITESFSDQPSGVLVSEPAQEGGYAHSLRRIRGRRSYKPHAEMSLRTVSARPTKHTRKDSYVCASPYTDAVMRPTVHVVGRKRKPLDEEGLSDLTVDAAEEATEAAAGGKRMRLLERVVTPFASLVRRRTVASSTPLLARRSQPIVGINTDLPLHAPTGVLPLVDPLLHPESLKPSESPADAPLADPRSEKTNRCLVM